MIRAPQNGTPETDLDLAEIGRALALLMDAGQTFELRALPSGRSWIGDNLGSAVEAARYMGSGNLYYALNPCRAGLAGAAKNSDILARRWLLVDIDPIRATPDVMATEAEKSAALEVAKLVRVHLKGLGWPDPVVIDSGNGYHLLYRVDLPNDRLASTLVSGSLKALANLYDNDVAHVDPTVHNAGRIARLPGTWTRKGIATEDRPHRMARLVSIPQSLGIVSPEQIRSLVNKTADWMASNDEPSADAESRIKAPKARTGDPIAAWFRKALEGECAKAITAPAGTRHNVMRAAARTLAGYLHHRYLTEDEIRKALLVAGRRAELPADEARDVIDWGLTDGKDNPLPWPEKLDRPKGKAAGANGQANGGTKATPDRLTIRASEVVPQRVRWLWQDRVPIDFITVFAGRTGLGKSFVLCDLAARLSNGLDLPDGPSGMRGTPTSVLFISEDPYEYVLAPRLVELGADLDMIHFLLWDAMVGYTLDDVGFLERAWQECDRPKLICIDPPTNFLGDVDEHKNAEIRAVLMGLVNFLNKRDIACVLVTHVNKAAGKGLDALNRVMGSVAWTTTSRIAHTFAQDPDDPSRCLFVPMKNNLGPLAKGLAYRIESTEALATVAWLGTVDTTADEAMAGEKGTPRRVVAAEWLIERFREQLEWSSDDLIKQGKNEGVNRDALFEAKKALGIPKPRKVTEMNGDTHWVWWVPPDWPHFQRPQDDCDDCDT